jgi:hypothetical protein
MTAPARRHHRPSPYVVENLAVRLNRGPAALAWRWRIELLIFTTSAAAVWWLAHLITLTWAAITVAEVLAGLAGLPWTRRRFWCVLTRHRIHRLCWETRLHTRAGRLPLVLWTRPTKVGERAWVLCRGGICAEDFEDHTGELRATCFARDARVTRNTRWSQLVTIDIIRRDTLAPSHTVRSPLTGTVISLPAADDSGEAA